MIRRLVSETNSSSTHSLEIGSGYLIDSSDLNLNEDNNLVIELGQFGWGWEWETFTHFEDLVSYVFTAIKSDESLTRELISLIKFNYPIINEIIISDCDYSYVDHGSEHIEGMDASDLFDFIFTQGSELETGNDND